MNQDVPPQRQSLRSRDSEDIDSAIEQSYHPASSKMLSQTLYLFALSLLFTFIISVGVQLFPISPFSLRWQLRIAGALTGSAASALGGLVILQLAAFIDRDNVSLQKSWHAIGRWGVVAVLGFPLLIPIQLLAIFVFVSGGSNTQDAQIIDSALKTFIPCLFFAISFAAATPTWKNSRISYIMRWQNYQRFSRFNRMITSDRPF